MIIEHMSEGKSMRSFAALIPGVTPAIVQAWRETYHEFNHACERGEALSMLWWERLGMAGASGQLTRVAKEQIKYRKDENGKVIEEIHEKEMAPAGFNSAAWIFSMKNRFHWQDMSNVPGGNTSQGAYAGEVYKPPISLVKKETS